MAKVILALVVIVPLAACSAVSPSPSAASSSTPGIVVSGGSTPTGVSAPLATTTPAATTAPTSAPTAAVTGTSNAPSAVADAIKAVIVKGNQEEVQAIASQNPNLMSDTSSASYNTQTVQEINDLLNSGVTSISLDKLQWGTITLQSATTAEATDLETWTTNFSGGGTLQETDTNVYTLVLENGAWKVQNDQHPNSHTQQPPAGTPAPTPIAPVPTTPVVPITPLGSGQSQSQNWSGYAASGGTYTAVSGTWTVPNVSSATDGADATWVGIGGVTSTDLIQAGTSATVQGGQVTYSAWWETLPQSSQTAPLNINPGDVVSVSITQQSDGSWEILIQDITAAETYKLPVTYQSSLSSADWIEESPVAGRRLLLPLDNFGTITFTNGTTVVNGKQQTIAQAGGQPITMVTSGVALAQPSVLATDGAGFSVDRTSAASPRLSPGGGRGFQ